MYAVHIHGKIVIARLRARCVLESSNGVAGTEQTLPPDIIQTSHHTFGPQLDGETVMMKNSVWRRRVIDHCYHVDRDLGSVTSIVQSRVQVIYCSVMHENTK